MKRKALSAALLRLPAASAQIDIRTLHGAIGNGAAIVIPAPQQVATVRPALHPLIASGIRKAEKARKAAVIAQPMRHLFCVLRSGEVDEIDGRAVMHMPECDEQLTERAQWCEIAPAIRGWLDCWSRLAKDISLYHMGVMADRLERGQEITPRLVEQAAEEFELTITRIPMLEDGVILAAVSTTQIGWEMEKVMERGRAA